MPLLELANVTAQYGPVRVLHGVSLAVDDGQIVALLGANGAGKTTTLRAISGTVRRDGQISFQGRSLNRLAAEEIARAGVAHVPQGRGTMSQLTVWDNLRMGAYARRDRARIKQDYERVLAAFPALAGRRQQLAGTLSGGEQQMLAIARALMSRPRLLLMDEPSLGLAPLVVRSIFQLVRYINKEDGVAVLVVEQNAALALAASDHAYVLEVGRIAVSGKSNELQREESVRRSYLGY